MFRTDQNASAIYLYNLAHLAMGSTVMLAALNGGMPMPEQAHGGAIHVIPATAWAGVVMGQALIAIIAMAHRSYIGLTAIAFVGAFVNGYLAMFADHATFGFLVSKGAGVFAFLHGSIMLAAGIDACQAFLLKYGDRLK